MIHNEYYVLLIMIIIVSHLYAIKSCNMKSFRVLGNTDRLTALFSPTVNIHREHPNAA